MENNKMEALVHTNEQGKLWRFIVKAKNQSEAEEIIQRE